MEKPKPFFNKEDFSASLRRKIKASGYVKYIPEYSLKEYHKDDRESVKEQKEWFEQSWNWWVDPDGKIIPAYEMLNNLKEL
jgi:hypothetical protein